MNTGFSDDSVLRGTAFRRSGVKNCISDDTVSSNRAVLLGAAAKGSDRSVVFRGDSLEVKIRPPEENSAAPILWVRAWSEKGKRIQGDDGEFAVDEQDLEEVRQGNLVGPDELGAALRRERQAGQQQQGSAISPEHVRNA